MPLVEATGALFPLFVWDVRREVKVNVVDAFHFEGRWKLTVALWGFTTSEYMYLWLHWYSGTLREAVDVNTIVRGEMWICSVGEATSGLIRTEAVSNVLAQST